MRAVRFVGSTGPREYVSLLVNRGVVVIDTLPPDPNVTMRFHLDGQPLQLSPDRHARDFLDFATLIYIIDELEPREAAPDNWSRVFEVVFPVDKPEIWTKSRKSLAAILATLMGDRFDFEWLKRPALPGLGRHRTGMPRGFDVVCLFSGGMDSLCGAYELLAQGQKVLLVGHQADGATASAQTTLARALERRFPGAVRLIQCRVARAMGSRQHYALPRKCEDTHRPRSLLFLALALTVAKAANIRHVHMPENGLIAVNPPLQTSRLGSLTTRTAHPRFLLQLAEFLKAAELFAGSLRNPFLFQSKTDMLREIPADLEGMVRASTSCARPTRYQQLGVKHCGYCVPCIYRRVAMIEASLDHSTDYAFDVFRDLPQLTAIQQADFRALVTFARRVLSASPAGRDMLVLSHGTFSPTAAAALGPYPAKDLSPWSDMVLRWSEDFLNKVESLASEGSRTILGLHRRATTRSR